MLDAKTLGERLYTKFWERLKTDDARAFDQQAEAIKDMWLWIAQETLDAMKQEK